MILSAFLAAAPIPDQGSLTPEPGTLSPPLVLYFKNLKAGAIIGIQEDIIKTFCAPIYPPDNHLFIPVKLTHLIVPT